jgi:hypothetical protein
MKTVVEMAREAWVKAGEGWAVTDWFDDRAKAFEAFAALVREEATAEANARANASWTLMCEKMVAIEREACAKVCEKHGYDHYCGNVTDKIAETIRARGQT